MFTKRAFLATSSASALTLLTGCGEERPGPFVSLSPRSTDIHAHFFNGQDIPVTGFLSQVVLRGAHGAVVDKEAENAVIDLLSSILFGRTKTAAQELAELKTLSVMPMPMSEDAALKRDQTRVADGLRMFSEGAGSNALRAGDPAKQKLLQELNNLAPGNNTAGLRTQDRADQIAEAIYKPSILRTAGLGLPGPDQSILQLIKWAGLLTRDRRELLAAYKRLYGRKITAPSKQQEIEIVSPSLVDFEFWFIRPSRRKIDIQSQIAVMSRIAQLENDLVVLNFAPFCPLRAALEARKGRNWLSVVQNAVRKQGFAGVKLYPPMGFLPIGNTGTMGPRPGAQVSGAEVDRQLKRLYAWCVAEDVPIKAHANNSLGAQVCSGPNASPANWNDVIARYPKLRLNAAHFGGFHETHEGESVQCDGGPVDYEDFASELAREGTQVYVDLGYWTEVTGSNRNKGSREINRMKDLIAKNETLRKRIMYGSDWVMIGREKNNGGYLSDVKAAMAKVGLSEADTLSGNALSYLGLNDPNSKQTKRLRRFFPTGHKFFDLFGS